MAGYVNLTKIVRKQALLTILVEISGIEPLTS